MTRRHGNSAGIQAVLILWLCVLLSGCSRVAVRTGTPDQAGTPPPSAMANIEAQPQWFTCKIAADCMPVAGVCQSQGAVNKLFENQYLNYRTRMETQVECQPITRPLGSWSVDCIQHRCAVKP